ncbi:MAG: SBBP repeat-containing protein [Dokdonella sp.]
MIGMKILKKICLLLAISNACLVTVAQAASGDLDPTFGTAGRSVINFGTRDLALAMTRDAADNLYLVGVDDYPATRVTIAKIDSSGAPVTGFGTAGKVALTVGASPYDYASAVAVDIAGNIYVAASSNNAGSEDFAIIKLNANGQLASNFGNAGVARIDIAGGSDDIATALVLDPAGSIYATGIADVPGGTKDIAVIKLNTAGNLATEFGIGGKIRLDINGRYEGGTAMVIDAQGNLYVAGTTGTGTLSGSDMIVVKFDSTGQRVSGFGSVGIAQVHLAYGSHLSAIARDPSGVLYIVGGMYLPSGTPDFVVTKLTSSGQPAQDFGTAGTQTIGFGNASEATGVAVDSAGRVYVGGLADVYIGNLVGIAELTSDGALVGTFGDGGKKIIAPPANQGYSAYAISLRDDDHIYLAGGIGYGSSASNQGDHLVMRLQTRADMVFANGFE